MKTGILGGTFNPVHIGHLILAEEAREKLKLDRVIFVPTCIPPHKQNGDIAAAVDRYRMVKDAIRGNRHFCASDIEIRRRGRSYTIDTLRQLKKKYPRDEMYFITGSDLLRYLKEWKDLREVIRMVKFVVATRPGYPLAKIPAYIKTVQTRAVDVSAFEIRQRIKKGQSFRYLLPEAVYAYIIKRKLYV
ncbi:MAG TPA: nicotinate-nucleotide adenylyltransferase [Candidatus Omnitrophota bacterium]|nr:nicotinate-nucleotide adenylyltransferase [Candidatus Omnitrophota bacterium]HRZ15860.1 nicotinate-nucleotide adenylyltransferase [Candidatus Omnitrophota bacterium]